MSHDDFQVEPIPGLPERPPEGEKILWQGRPGWSGLAFRVFHIRKVAIYFTILLSWVGLTTLANGGTAAQSLRDVVTMLPFPIIAIGLLATLAYLYKRTTIYTITNKRVVLRFGIALTLSVGFPFSKVESASLRNCSDGTGDIALKTIGPDKMAYLHLWPFARPWHFKEPQPMMRSLKNADEAAAVLRAALAAELGSAGVVADSADDVASDVPGMVPAE